MRPPSPGMPIAASAVLATSPAGRSRARPCSSCSACPSSRCSGRPTCRSRTRISCRAAASSGSRTTPPIGLAAGLGVAIMLNQKIRLIGFYRTCFLVPFVASAAAEGLLFGFIFDPDFGIVNAGLNAVGLPRQGFLQDPSEALVVLAIVYFWTQFGFNIVIYLAALQDIPQEVLEAASIDGASKWSTFWNVVVPTIRPVTVFLLVWSLIDVFQFFDLVYTTTKGGPLNSTLTLVYYIWELAFNFFTAGYGAAVAYVLFFASLIVTIVALVYGRRNRVAL